MNRSEILDTAKDCVMRDRNATHGEPENNFQCIANLYNAYLRGTGVRALLPHDVAVLNILQKISRIVTSPECADHWVDIAGYAACGGGCATKEPKKKLTSEVLTVNSLERHPFSEHPTAFNTCNVCGSALANPIHSV